MQIFNLTLSQMLLMFTLIVAGFVLRKKMLLPDNADKTMSKLETFLITPALNLYTQMTRCTVDSFKQNWVLILYGAAITVAVLLLAPLLSRLFVKKSDDSKQEYQRSIYKYSMSFSNSGFMGNFIILGVFGEEMFYKYLLITLVYSILCSSYGLYILIPKDKNMGLWHNLKKGLLTPMVIGTLSGIVMGLLNLKQYIPDFIVNALDSVGGCQGPVAMVLAGFVIGGYSFNELITNKKVYAASLVRLIAIPAAILLVLKAIGTTDQIMTLALIAFGTPLGLNTIVYPAAYGGDTKTGASMTMISHTLSVVTIPLMFLLFITIL